MALEVKDIETIEDMQYYVEGCLNDLDMGISTKEETLSNLKDYTFRVIEMCVKAERNNKDKAALPIQNVSVNEVSVCNCYKDNKKDVVPGYYCKKHKQFFALQTER